MIRRKVDDSLHFQSYLQVAAHRFERENKHTGKKGVGRNRTRNHSKGFSEGIKYNKDLVLQNYVARNREDGQGNMIERAS